MPLARKKKKQLKCLRIPRLELLVMLIGARAANFLVKELGVYFQVNFVVRFTVRLALVENKKTFICVCPRRS